MVNKNIFWQSFQALDSWLIKNKYQGYDPYDIRSYIPSRLLTRILERLIPPLLLRKIFRVKKLEYPLVYSHCAQAYLRAYQITQNEDYLKKAKKCLEWLENNNWGEPFDWRTKIFIPRHTPDAYNYVNIAQTFLLAYKILKKDSYFKKIRNITQELLNKLNVDEIVSDKICFSYTPLDHFHVHNVNLYVASLLFEVGTLEKNNFYLNLAKKALNYSLSQQREDGAFYYWGEEEGLKENYIDNYHTIFVLSSLFNIWQITREGVVKKSLDRGLDFYLKNLLEDDFLPKSSPKSLHPLDIHSFAHAIIFFSRIGNLFPQSPEIAQKIARWAIDNFQDRETSFFYYQIKRNGIDKTPYIRWAEAPMLNALSFLL
jgi:hypothetical protein